MTAKRFIIDDAGTLIDMETRNTYDYVDEVCPLLNELNNKNTALKDLNNQELQAYEDNIKHIIRESIQNERTELGKSVLKQLLEAIQ